MKAAIEALVSDVLRRREPTSSDERAIVDDLRTIPQIQADALAAIARHSLGCAQTITPLAKTTVVVGLDLETLRSGIGHACIDGIDQPISAATARRMAADGGLIPAVLGGQNIASVEAHHIAWWERDAGPTDLANGVLLCSFCHRMVHRDGWGIRATAGSVWFIPPPHVDPHQTPRLGGRARFESAVALSA